MSNFAWVTLTTNDAYSLGALVLAHSLKRVGTAHQLVVLVTPTVSEAMRIRLREVYNLVQEVNVLDSQDAANLALLARPELGITFTKLHAWRLVQFEKCVFLDSDILVLQNADELFEREEFSAAPDVSWPDCFNSGVFVYRPNETTFSSLIEFALKNGSFDGGDQGVLNSYFSDWAQKDISKHLPFTYNTTAFATYSYLPAFKQFRDKIKILHFAGKLKPWLLNFNSETKTAYIPSEFQHAADLIQMWWNIFCDNVHQNLTDQMQNYWRNMELRNVPMRTDNRQTSDSCPSNNKPNYDMGNFFDDIQPYRDPWEDYYEQLENLIEQNSSNNNATSDNQTQSPPPPPPATTTTPLPPQFEPTVEQNSNTNITPEYVPPAAPTPPPVLPMLELHQFSPLIEDLYNDNVTKDSATNFIENIVQSFDQQLIAINRTMDQHKRRTSDTNQTPPSKGSSSTTTPVSSERDSSAETESSNKDSNSISNLSLKSSDDEGKLLVENLQFDKKLGTNEAGLAGALAKVRLGEPRTTEQEAYEESMRRQCWESGNIDYSGKDSFDNIWKKISQTLDSKPGKPSGSN